MLAIASLIFTLAPIYFDMASTDSELRGAYSKFVFQQSPYDPIVDKEFRII